MDPQSEKLEQLSERIRQAEVKQNPQPEEAEKQGRNAGYDFAGTILGSVIFGVLLDRMFGTTPWCLVGAVVLGFITGTFFVMRGLNQSEDK